MEKCPKCGSQNIQIQKNVLLYLYDKPTTAEQVVICLECGYLSQVIGRNKAELICTIIKETDLYKERLEPAWEYPNPDDQWLFAKTVEEYVGTEYDVLYVYDDNTYKEERGLTKIPESVLATARNDLDYDEVKRGMKKRSFWKK